MQEELFFDVVSYLLSKVIPSFGQSFCQMILGDLPGTLALISLKHANFVLQSFQPHRIHDLPGVEPFLCKHHDLVYFGSTSRFSHGNNKFRS